MVALGSLKPQPTSSGSSASSFLRPAGSAGGSRCKWCKRTRTTGNPFKRGKLAAVPFLPFARESGQECAPCRNMKGKVYRTVDKNALYTEIQENPAKQKEYDRALDKWQKAYNRVKGGKAEGPADSEDDDDEGQSSHVGVSIVEGRALKTEKVLGILWPTKVWSKLVKRPLPKKDIVTVNHCGVQVRGVLRRESFGMPEDCIKVYTEGSCTIMKGTKAEDSSDDELRPGQKQDRFNALSSHVGYSAIAKPPTADEDGNEEDLGVQVFKKPKLSTPRKQRAGDSGSESEADLLFPDPIKVASASEKAAKPEKESKRGKQDPQPAQNDQDDDREREEEVSGEDEEEPQPPQPETGKKRVTKRKRNATTGTPGEGDTAEPVHKAPKAKECKRESKNLHAPPTLCLEGKKVSKKMREYCKVVNASENLAMEIEQLVQNIQTNPGLQNSTAIQIRNLKMRTEKALGASNVAVLSGNPEEDIIDIMMGESDVASIRGMQVLERLTRESKSLSAVQSLVASVSCKTTMSDPLPLSAAMQICEEANLKPPPLVHTILLNRGLASMAQQENWEGFAAMLNPESEPDEKASTGNIGIWRLWKDADDLTSKTIEAAISETQEKHTMQQVLKMFRAESSWEAFGRLLTALSFIKIRNGKVFKGINAFGVLVNAMNSSSVSVSSEDIKKAKEIVLDEDSAFAKPLLLFPHGAKLLCKIEKITKSLDRDKTLIAEISKFLENVEAKTSAAGAGQPPDFEDFAAAKAFAEGQATICRFIARVEQTASENFKKAHSENLGKLRDYLDASAFRVQQFQAKPFTAEVLKLFQVALSDSPAPASEVSAKLTCMQVDKRINSKGAQTGLDKIMSPEVLTQNDKVVDDRLMLLTHLKYFIDVFFTTAAAVVASPKTAPLDLHATESVLFFELLGDEERMMATLMLPAPSSAAVSEPSEAGAGEPSTSTSTDSERIGVVRKFKKHCLTILGAIVHAKLADAVSETQTAGMRHAHATCEKTRMASGRDFRLISG